MIGLACPVGNVEFEFEFFNFLIKQKIVKFEEQLKSCV